MGKKGINLENLINYLKILKTGMSHRRNRTPTRNWFLLRTPFPSSLLQETRLCPAVPIESQASSTPSHDHSPSRRLMKCKEAGDQGSRSIGSLSAGLGRSEEHTSELQSLMRISYAVFCLKKKTNYNIQQHTQQKEDNK